MKSEITLILCIFIIAVNAQTKYLYESTSNAENEYIFIGSFESATAYQTNPTIRCNRFTTTCQSVTLCINYLIYPPLYSELWEENCDIYAQITDENFEISFPALPGVYQLYGLFSEPDCSLGLEVVTNSCPENKFGENCEAATSLNVTNVEIGPQESKLFVTNINTFNTQSLEIIITSTSQTFQNISAYGREGAAPDIENGIYDVMNNTQGTNKLTLAFSYPIQLYITSNGEYNYLVTIVNNDPQNEITVSVVGNIITCESDRTGENCANYLPILHPEDYFSYIFDPTSYDNHWIYGEIFLLEDADKGSFTTTLSVIGSYDELGETTIYYRFGNIPTEDNFDARISGVTLRGSTLDVPSPCTFFSGMTDTHNSSWFMGIHDPNDRTVGFSFIDSNGGSEYWDSNGGINEYNDENGDSVNHDWTYYLAVIFTIICFCVVVVFIIFVSFLLSRRSVSSNQPRY